MSDDRTRAHIWVSGVVQGVFYRASTIEEARARDLDGWVKNLPDGRVEILAEGPETQVRSLIAWTHVGPTHAVVERVEIQWEEAKNLEGFSVAY